MASESTEETYPFVENVSFMKFPDGGFSLVLGTCEHDAFFSVNCLNVEACVWEEAIDVYNGVSLPSG